LRIGHWVIGMHAVIHHASNMTCIAYASQDDEVSRKSAGITAGPGPQYLQVASPETRSRLEQKRQCVTLHRKILHSFSFKENRIEGFVRAKFQRRERRWRRPNFPDRLCCREAGLRPQSAGFTGAEMESETLRSRAVSRSTGSGFCRGLVAHKGHRIPGPRPATSLAVM
jgi:hypothetical protein